MRRSRSKVRIRIKNKGSLSKYGYYSYDPSVIRHAALNKAIKEYGPLATFKKINALSVFNRRNSELRRIYDSDKNWVRIFLGTPYRSSRSRSKSCSRCSRREKNV